VPGVLVVEGCGAAQRSVDAFASLRIWVEAPAALRLERGLARDGEAIRAEWERWMTLEAEHFARESTRERADVLVDGTVGLAP
jgi:uridine kinase